jgi:hypothetical protein
MGGTKPKGLSIRSNSDMNVSSIHSIKKSTHGKEQDSSKLKVTQIDSSGRPISPGKETPAKVVKFIFINVFYFQYILNICSVYIENIYVICSIYNKFSFKF